MNPLSFPRKRESNNKAQAAAELAVFGAILIFILGTIVRSAAGNSYTQNENYKAMRMAMLISWQDSESTQGKGALANTSHNNASILIVEDRLSPDFNKYGDLDRNPYIAQGSGSFTYELLYPLEASDLQAAARSYPIMDVYINGQHFPFTTATFVQNRTIARPTSCGAGAVAQSPTAADAACVQNNCQALDPASIAYQQCLQNCQLAEAAQCGINQCLRNVREWAGGTVSANQFESVIPIPLSSSATATLLGNANAILADLVNAGLISPEPGVANQYIVNSTFPTAAMFPDLTLTSEQVTMIQDILQTNQHQYKLFYSMVANTGGGSGASQSSGASGANTTQYSVEPPMCWAHPCKDKELSMDLVLGNTSDHAGTDGALVDGDLMFDFQRNGATNVQLENTADPIVTPAVPPGLRPYMAWQWSATAATTADLIGLDVDQNQYPSYDVDGRLKMVTIYSISQAPDTGFPTVSYEDFQGGDIDSSWDANSCGPKPGLQSNSQIYTFTQDGTYLQIKEGQMYNPQTGKWVSSVNKRNSIDLIQRTIQLSTNTGRFCSQACADGSQCQANGLCDNGITCSSPVVQNPVGGTNVPNPVEVCVDSSNTTNPTNCFGTNIALTCYDVGENIIYVRSRLEDRRGNSWLTNASGQLKVQ